MRFFVEVSRPDRATVNRVAARLPSRIAFQPMRTTIEDWSYLRNVSFRFQSSFRFHASRKIIRAWRGDDDPLPGKRRQLQFATVKPTRYPRRSHVRSPERTPATVSAHAIAVRGTQGPNSPRTEFSPLSTARSPRRLLAALPRTGSRRIARPATK